jgi:hypothetical protein
MSEIFNNNEQNFEKREILSIYIMVVLVEVKITKNF